MHIRHSIQPTSPVNIIDARFDQDNDIFTASTSTGFAIYKTWPLTLLKKRDLTKGTLSAILPLHSSSLLFLLGGGRSPLYPPNKVIVWDDAVSREVAELEFRERVMGLAARRGWLAVALKRRVVVYRISDGVIVRHQEWITCVNMRGLLALATAPDSTLLAIPGRQEGHVQLIHLPPCPVPPPPPIIPPPISPFQRPPPIPAPGPPASIPPANHKSPITIIRAHTTQLTTLSLPPSGRLLATTSERGTLIRVWDSSTGEKVRELRRGSDKAIIYGVAFRADESELCVWSDKGTIHVFKLGVKDSEGGGSNNRQSSFSPLSPFLRLPKYFASEWSYAFYRLPAPSSHISLSSAIGSGTMGEGKRKGTNEDEPEEQKCVVGWIQVPVSSRDPSASYAAPAPTNKSKGKTPPEEEEVWRMQYQLVALTYSGCWYRLSVPSSPTATATSTPSAAPDPSVMPKAPPTSHSRLSTHSSTTPSTSSIPIPTSHRRPSSISSTVPSSVSSSPPSRVQFSSSSPPQSPGRSSPTGKGKEKEEPERVGRDCILEEFRRFGRWDGWG